MWIKSLFFESPQASGRYEYTMASVLGADQQPLARVKGICAGLQKCKLVEKVVVIKPAEYYSLIDSVKLTYHLGYTVIKIRFTNHKKCGSR